MSEGMSNCNIAVVLEGGVVQEIVTDCSDAFGGINFIVIDYDKEDYREADLVPVVQGDGSAVTAYAEFLPLEESAIDLAGLSESLAARHGGET